MIGGHRLDETRVVRTGNQYRGNGCDKSYQPKNQRWGSETEGEDLASSLAALERCLQGGAGCVGHLLQQTPDTHSSNVARCGWYIGDDSLQYLVEATWSRGTNTPRQCEHRYRGAPCDEDEIAGVHGNTKMLDASTGGFYPRRYNIAPVDHRGGPEDTDELAALVEQGEYSFRYRLRSVLATPLLVQLTQKDLQSLACHLDHFLQQIVGCAGEGGLN